jgi:hypothetical protein
VIDRHPSSERRRARASDFAQPDGRIEVSIEEQGRERKPQLCPPRGACDIFMMKAELLDARRRLHASTLAAAILAVGGSLSFVANGCGSSTDTSSVTNDASIATEEAGVADGSPTDASTGRDGSVTPGCPASVPADSTPCPELILQCEYGQYEFVDCNATATCTRDGWSVAPAPAASACGQNNTMCPSTADTIVRGGSCELVDVTCNYPDATCACLRNGDGGAGASWACDDSLDSTCPRPRPKLGTPCAVPAQTCDYDTCGPFHNITEVCRDGLWRFVFPTCDGGF